MQSPEDKERFKPTGAMAFFILLVILALAFWYGIYFLMIGRV
jgi:cytochrome c oxidase subunit IIa family protein